MHIISQFRFTAALTTALGVAALLLFLLPQTAHADWTANRINGMVTVTDLPGEDIGPQIMRLGSGYYYIEWRHVGLTDDPGRLWYQILDPLGNPLLNSTGNLVLSGATWSYGSTTYLVPDGEGGVITVFNDDRAGGDMPRPYGQRFNQWGQPLWGPTGILLAEWPGWPGLQHMYVKDATSNPNGELFFSWAYYDSSFNTDLYVQKVSNSGDRLWGASGVPAGTGTGNQNYPQVVPDTSGGALVLWEDTRAGGYTYYLYAQHYNENGIAFLIPNGSPVHYPGTTTQMSCGGLAGGMPDDSSGGVFVYTTPSSSNLLRVFRVNGDGETQWVWDNGISAQHFVAQVLKHPVDDTIWIAANDNHTGGFQAYLYQLDLDGNPLFNPAGIIGGSAMAPTSNGVITFEKIWNTVATRVIAKRFDNRGNQIWESIVALARTFPGSGPALVPITSSQDGNDGAVITMIDDRLELNEFLNIAAQRMQWNGRLGNPTGPQEPILTQKLEMSVLSGNLVQFTLPRAGQVKLELFDLLGRRIATLREEYQSAGMHTTEINDSNLPSGVYLLRLTTPTAQQVVKMTIAR